MNVHTESDLHPKVWLQRKQREENQSQTIKKVSLPQIPVCVEISLTIVVANECAIAGSGVV